jgi:hypothetical protein
VLKVAEVDLAIARGHHLNSFVRWYQLGDDLGPGGYGFVLGALHLLELREVAVP